MIKDKKTEHQDEDKKNTRKKYSPPGFVDESSFETTVLGCPGGLPCAQGGTPPES